MSGEGTLTQGGVRYRGQFQAGRKHGKGVEVDKDGTRAEGTWKDGERDGKFIIYDRNGNVAQKITYVKGRAEGK